MKWRKGIPDEGFQYTTRYRLGYGGVDTAEDRVAEAHAVMQLSHMEDYR